MLYQRVPALPPRRSKLRVISSPDPGCRKGYASFQPSFSKQTLFTFSSANSTGEKSGDDKEKSEQERNNTDKLNTFMRGKDFAIISVLGLKYKYPAAILTMAVKKSYVIKINFPVIILTMLV
jgi:hypothetical protein